MSSGSDFSSWYPTMEQAPGAESTSSAAPPSTAPAAPAADAAKAPPEGSGPSLASWYPTMQQQGTEAPPAESSQASDGDGLEPGILDGFRAAVTKAGLSEEQSRAVFNAYAENERQLSQAFESKSKQWAEEIRRDPEVGGDRFNESLTHVRTAVDALGGREVAEMLASAGLGNHPGLFKGLATIGRLLSKKG